MKKRIVCLLLTVLMLASVLPVTAAAADVDRHSYLQKGDYIVISPAEQWNENGKRVAVKTTEWELTAQHKGTANGNDIQTWKFGTSDKFYIDNAETKADGITYVRIRCKNFRESGGGRYWDIEGRSKKPGGNLHVWSFKNGAASQWFYLEEDHDGDGETFFIKNMNSKLYLAPENYFKSPKNNCGMKRNAWSEEGCNVVQSNYAFRWRIQVLNRDAVLDADTGAQDKYANWMGLLPDDRYLSSLNIPGTHDSGTTNVEGSWNASLNIVACQKYFIHQQLYAGVRSFDIRTAWNKDSNDMVLVHGGDSYVCHTPDHGNSRNKTFRSVLDTFIRYLEAHPTETIIMTLKIDGSDKEKCTEELRSILNEYIKPVNGTRRFYDWTGGDTVGSSYDIMQRRMVSPRLGDVRGKIVMLTRVNFDTHRGTADTLYRYVGPDLSLWDKSYQDTKYYAQKVESGSSVKVYIQDDYSSPDANKKKQVLYTIQQLNGRRHITGSERPAESDFVFNYASKTTSDTYEATPLGGARYMNSYLYNDDLFTPGTKAAKQNLRLGIVVMDFVNKQLCRRIIDRNKFPSSAGMSAAEAGLATQSIDEEAISVLAVDGQSGGTVIWPESAVLTYGYVLGEAQLNFQNGQSGGQEGTFRFETPDEIIPATQSVDSSGAVMGNTPVYRTLIFSPADSSAEQTASIPVTVYRRPLPIKIADYEVEYGGMFLREELSVTAGGYLLAWDLENLNYFIDTYDIRWLLTDSHGNEYRNPDVPPTDVLDSGTIELRAGNGSGMAENPNQKFPNYAAHVEIGTWAVVPRTVTVSWQAENGQWTARLGNILPGDEVYPVLSADGTLTLAGASAGCYQLADEDTTAPSDPPADSIPAGVLAAITGKPTGKLPFADVQMTHYAVDAIRWAWENGYFSGVSSTQFDPEQGLSRAMLVTILWRMEGSPKVSISSFTDVLPGGWYEKAVAWDASRGIVSGTSQGMFAPDLPVTREQLAVILWRCAGSSQPEGDLSAFADAGTVSSYAADAVTWAVQQGILTGANGRLLPASGATRAQVALMLQRFAAHFAQ